MEQLFDRLMQAFSVEFIFTVIIASYFVIKCMDILNGSAPLASWVKKLATIIIGALVFGVFCFITDIPKETLLSSYFAALFIYDYAIKWLLKKFRVNYKE